VSFAYRNSGADWIWRPRRFAIYERDAWTCLVCGESRAMRIANGLSLDHVMPRSAGGSNEASNLITVCIPCNSARCDLPVVDYGSAIRQRIARALRKPIDMQRGRLLCEVLYPGWLARQTARKRSTSFEFGANA